MRSVLVTLMLLAGVGALLPFAARAAEDPFDANNNPPGSACFKKVAEIRKLEKDPKFDSNKPMRQRWQRLVDEADRMKCKL